MMKKKMLKLLITVMLVTGCMGLTACGFADDKDDKRIEGELLTVMDEIFEKANLDSDFKEAYAGYTKGEITEAEKEYLLGTTDIEFKEGVYAMPAMSSIAFQAVLLRLNDDQDPDAVEDLLEKNADPRKWVCVEPEEIDADNVGNVVLFIMGDEKNTEALFEAFDTYE